jgi:hypothetical protein
MTSSGVKVLADGRLVLGRCPDDNEYYKSAYAVCHCGPAIKTIWPDDIYGLGNGLDSCKRVPRPKQVVNRQTSLFE